MGLKGAAKKLPYKFPRNKATAGKLLAGCACKAGVALFEWKSANGIGIGHLPRNTSKIGNGGQTDVMY